MSDTCKAADTMPGMIKQSRYRFQRQKEIREGLHVQQSLQEAFMYGRCRATGAITAKWYLETNKGKRYVCAPQKEGFQGFEKALIGQISKDEVCTEVE